MAQNSSIEWTSDTWNPWQGCRKISAGCANCYMFRDKKRFGQNGNDIYRSSDATFYKPLKLKGPFVFTCSWSDFFLPDADEWRQEAWDVIRDTPHLTYQILTKRPERIAECLPANWGNGWPNVWLGVSVETQSHVYRMDVLRGAPAVIRFVSAEPLLGPLNLNLNGFHWVITGGESGPGYRETEPEWFRLVRSTAIAENVAYFHKQNGGNRKVNGSWGGNLLDGQTWQQMPLERVTE